MHGSLAICGCVLRQTVLSKRLSSSLPGLVLVALLGLMSPLFAAEPDFWHGKVLRLVVGYEAGGGYDTFGRLVAPFLGRHLPGQPVIVVENMPGAGSVQATNYIYNIAPKDGTVIGIVSKSMVVYQMLGGREARWDSMRLNWIGRIDGSNTIMYGWDGAGLRSLDDAKTKVMRVGATGRSTDSYIFPAVTNALLGTRFDIVVGYAGGSAALDLAMERGEIDGRAGDAWTGFRRRDAGWLKEGKVHVLFQVGLAKEKDLPDTPLLSDLVTDPEAKSLVEVVSLPTAIGFSLMAPPDIPADKLKAWRDAFDATFADPDFVAEMQRQNLSLSEESGARIAEKVHDIVTTTSPAALAKAKPFVGEGN